MFLAGVEAECLIHFLARVGVESLRVYDRVVIWGVGLIGGSVGLALRKRGGSHRVIGLGRDRSRLDQAVALGAIDAGTTDVARACDGADLVVVATPVDQVARCVIESARLSRSETLVTDAGSAKATIVAAVEKDAAARGMFVAAHPIAGSERSGVAAARADLFEGATCVLTPGAHTNATQLVEARAFWAGIGCRVIEMSPDEHDRALALTSHLPHAVAAALATVVPPELFPLAAGAYRDSTRVAAADAALWAAILLQNSDETLRALDQFGRALADCRQLLADHDQAGLEAWWHVAAANRRGFRGTQA